MRATHTYALLPISPDAFSEIRDKLSTAGYGDQIHDAGKTVDMHGLAIVPDTAGLSTIDAVHSAFDLFRADRTKQSAKAIIDAGMNLTFAHLVEHKGAYLGMADCILECFVDDEQTQDAMEQFGAYFPMLRDWVLTDPHALFEYRLNHWLFSRDDSDAEYIRNCAEKSEPLQEYLKANVETAALLEA